MNTLIIILAILFAIFIIYKSICIYNCISKLKKTIKNQRKTIKRQEDEINVLKFIHLPLMTSSIKGPIKESKQIYFSIIFEV